MENTDPNTPRADFAQTIQRAAEAYLAIRAQLKKDAFYGDDQANQYKASLAYIAHLPILLEPTSCLVYIACVARGVGIGAIDVADAGRLCHLAQSAISAWKLVNLVIPEAEERDRQAKKKEKDDAERQSRKSEEKETLPPSKGNQPYGPGHPDVEAAIQNLLDNLPSFEEQKRCFQILRTRGHLLPGDGELRDHPITALHLIRMAHEIIRNEALAEAGLPPIPSPSPAQAPPRQPQQAA